MKPRIIFVDDDPIILRTINRMLSAYACQWEILSFSDSQEAWEYIESHPVDSIVTDVTMPRMSGIELLQKLRSHELTRHVPVVMLTGLDDALLKSQVLDMGATDLLNKPFQSADLLSRLRSMLRLKAAEDELREKNRNMDLIVQQRTRELRQSRMQIIWRLAKAGEFRDEETGEHVVRVAACSRILGRALGLSHAECEHLYLAAPLHDIGKIGIPDAILLKPGRLTDNERAIIQTHCEIGERILREPSLTELCVPEESVCQDDREKNGDVVMEAARLIAIAHHERWDGRGYPHRLRGNEIPLVARIVSVADVFDALTSSRPYKSALPVDEVVRIVTNGRGTQFDPEVIETFQDSLDELIEVRQQVAHTQQHFLDATQRETYILGATSFSVGRMLLSQDWGPATPISR
jgi:response regulator RpfG family c-di-GMP phosphodiesterase